MRYSIRCTGHPASDSRGFQDGWFDDIETAQQEAFRQTQQHRSLGLDCVFEVRTEDDRPQVTEEEMRKAARIGYDVSGYDLLPTL